jgi:hypothetical protein
VLGQAGEVSEEELTPGGSAATVVNMWSLQVLAGLLRTPLVSSQPLNYPA